MKLQSKSIDVGLSLGLEEVEDSIDEVSLGLEEVEDSNDEVSLGLEEVEDSNDEVSNSEELEGNSAMADAMRKVLNMGKNMGKSSLVLAKAKTGIKKPLLPIPAKESFEIDKDVDDVKDVIDSLDEKPDVKPLRKKRIKKQEISALGRVKPSPLDREKERPLMKIATKGVVQLFNAVKEQQNIINDKIKEVGKSETKKDKVLKSIDKRAFLDVLLGHPQDSHPISDPEIKTEDEADEDKSGPSWGVLRDDFMTGAKLKDWDKVEIEELPQPSSAKKTKR